MLDCLKKTKWLNLFTRTYKDKKGTLRYWDFCSRKENPDEKSFKADAIVVVPFLDDGRMVLIKQFRPAINDYIIEHVAGLHDQYSIFATAKKELKEETGLDMIKSMTHLDKIYNSPGITDESCSYVFCLAQGEITTKFCEDSEDIEVIVVDRQQAKDLLSEEKVSAKCWLILQAYADGHDWRCK